MSIFLQSEDMLIGLESLFYTVIIASTCYIHITYVVTIHKQTMHEEFFQEIIKTSRMLEVSVHLDNKYNTTAPFTLYLVLSSEP